MLTNDDLDLARAKAIAFPNYSAEDREWAWKKLSGLNKQMAHEKARAIRPADAALGVVSVPVEATEEMLIAGLTAIPHPDQLYIRWKDLDLREMDLTEAAHGWSAMLAASPLREKPDEPR